MSASPLLSPYVVPSWRALSDLAVPQDFINGPNFITPSRELQSLRLFGQTNADVRLVLYRDHASWCPYCHKVQLLIEAKRIPYLVKKINMSCYGAKPQEFLKKVPSGLLPVIELDGKVITESMDIMFLLEDTFQTPYRKMIPTDDNDMMQSFHRYLRLERVFLGAWLSSLRGPMAMLPRALQPVNQTLDIIEKSLAEFAGPFFYPGDEPSFVDINFSTVFERARSSLKYWRSMDIVEGRPNLAKWFYHWDKWQPALLTRSDDWTHIGALPPQIGPVKFTANRLTLSHSVETARGKHVLNDGPEGKLMRNIAAETMCRNSALVVKDAIRGGKVPEKHHAHVDLAFRIMANALYDPDVLEALEDTAREQMPRECWKDVGDAIRFERARCCSPRDMPLLAMHQFCGVINWLLRTLGQEL
ncbi:unnamed protein product [Agarophyton chilense]